MRITNKHLVRAFDFSLTQVKRWAVLLLGPDPLTGQSSGVPRGYHLDEAFMIYLLGLLVRDYQFRLQDAKTHTLRIWRELERQEWLPSDFKKMSTAPTLVLTIYPRGPHYELKRYLRLEQVGQTDWQRGRERWLAEYETQWFPPLAIDERPPGPEYTLPLSYQAKRFLYTLAALI